MRLLKYTFVYSPRVRLVISSVASNSSSSRPARSLNLASFKPSVLRSPFTNGNAAGVIPNYLSRIQARLRARKHYPEAAKASNITGQVVVQFLLDRIGRVRDYRIRVSSGHKILRTFRAI